MRIEITKDCLSVYGLRRKGDVLEVDEKSAAALIASGYAVAVKPVRKVVKNVRRKDG